MVKSLFANFYDSNTCVFAGIIGLLSANPGGRPKQLRRVHLLPSKWKQTIH